jgi:indolepyruvate decarboxylase
LARAATGESASYIEVVGGRMDLPKGLALAHQRLEALYGDA